MFAGRYPLFRDRESFEQYFSVIGERARIIEDRLGQETVVRGYCDCCADVVDLRILSGATFGSRPNLREGMICPNGLSNRQRLLYRVLSCCRRNDERLKLALFEDLSPLAARLRRLQFLATNPSLYLGDGHRSGDSYVYRSSVVAHQDITASSYVDRSVDLALHNDVLEHVPDTDAVFAELARILKDGGLMVMTAPFFPARDRTMVLATRRADGSVEHHIDPAEYHGDPVAGDILAYYRFGWDLLAKAMKAGFKDAFVVCDYDAHSGLVTNNNWYSAEGNMPPVAIIGVK